MSKTRHRQGLSHQEQKAKRKTQLKQAKTMQRLEALASSPITLGHSVHHDNQFFADCYQFWQGLSLPQKISVFIAAIAVGSVFTAAFYCLLTCEDSANSTTYQRMMISHNVISPKNHTSLSNSSTMPNSAVSNTIQPIYATSRSPITHAATSSSSSSQLRAFISLEGIGLPVAAAKSTAIQPAPGIHVPTPETILRYLNYIEQDITDLLTGPLGQIQGPSASKVFSILSKAIHEMRQACKTPGSDLSHVNRRLEALEQFRHDYNRGVYVLKDFLSELETQMSTAVNPDGPFKTMLDHVIVNYNPQTIKADFCYNVDDRYYLESLNTHRKKLVNKLLNNAYFLSYFMKNPQEGYLFDQAFHGENSYQHMLRPGLSRDELLTFLKNPIFTSKVNIVDFFKNIKTIDLNNDHQASLPFYEYLEWYYIHQLANKEDTRALIRDIIQKDESIRHLKHQFEESFLIQDSGKVASGHSKYDVVEVIKHQDPRVMSKADVFDMTIANAHEQLSRCQNNAYYVGLFHAPKFWLYLINPLGGKNVLPELVFAMLTGGSPFHLEDNEAIQYTTTQLFNYLGLHENLTIPIYNGHSDTLLLSFAYREFFEHAAKQQGLLYFEVPAFRHLHYWSYYRHHSHLSLADFCAWLTPSLEEIKALRLPVTDIDAFIREGINTYSAAYRILLSSLYLLATILSSAITYRLFRHTHNRATRQTLSLTTSSRPRSTKTIQQSQKPKHHNRKDKETNHPANTDVSLSQSSIIPTPASSIVKSETVIRADLILRFNNLVEWHQRQIKRANGLYRQLKALEPQMKDWQKPTIQAHLKTLHKMLKNKAPDTQQEQNEHYINTQQSVLERYKAQLPTIVRYIEALRSSLDETETSQIDNLSMLMGPPETDIKTSDTAAGTSVGNQPSAQPAETMPSSSTAPLAGALSDDDEPLTSLADASDDDHWLSLDGSPSTSHIHPPISLFQIGPTIWGPPSSSPTSSSHGPKAFGPKMP